MDLDNCRDSATGEISPAAASIIEELSSYTEVSPSGTGVKIFLRAPASPGSRHRTKYEGGEIEIYFQGRYFTVTGDHLPGTPLATEHRHDELQRVYDRLFGKPAASAPKAPPLTTSEPAHETAREMDAVTVALNSNLTEADIIEMRPMSRNGEKFAALFIYGDASAYGGNQSAADIALCNMLAFWCRNDVGRMDSLFRHSRLMRPKWDEKHWGDGRTYGQMTIQQALDLPHQISRPEPQ